MFWTEQSIEIHATFQIAWPYHLDVLVIPHKNLNPKLTEFINRSEFSELFVLKCLTKIFKNDIYFVLEFDFITPFFNQLYSLSSTILYELISFDEIGNFLDCKKEFDGF